MEGEGKAAEVVWCMTWTMVASDSSLAPAETTSLCSLFSLFPVWARWSQKVAVLSKTASSFKQMMADRVIEIRQAWSWQKLMRESAKWFSIQASASWRVFATTTTQVAVWFVFSAAEDFTEVIPLW